MKIEIRSYTVTARRPASTNSTSRPAASEARLPFAEPLINTDPKAAMEVKNKLKTLTQRIEIMRAKFTASKDVTEKKTLRDFIAATRKEYNNLFSRLNGTPPSSIATAPQEATAAKGDVFAPKDRIASNWDGEWWLATVKKVHPNGDCDVVYDTGDKDTYPKKYMNTAAIKKLPADTPKRKQSCTLNVVKAIIQEAVVPASAPGRPISLLEVAAFHRTLRAACKGRNLSILPNGLATTTGKDRISLPIPMYDALISASRLTRQFDGTYYVPDPEMFSEKPSAVPADLPQMSSTDYLKMILAGKV